MSEKEAIIILNNDVIEYEKMLEEFKKVKSQTKSNEMLRNHCKKGIESCRVAIQALEEIQEYRAIGTLEQCREAVERMKPKKLDIEARSVGEYLCGNCYEPIPRWDTKYCPNCGHAIDRNE